MITDLKKVKKIFHISDVHIRMNKRHSEYRRVFENLYNYINENKTDESLIVLTGDILHSKVEISPECMNETQLFLYNLSSICPTLMILGNHDCLLSNHDRLDSLTPIVNSLNNKNLIYSKDTEIISIGDVDFYHWSVYSKKQDFIKPKGENKKICLYHGLVNNSKNDFGFVMKSDSISVEDFEGFDLVLLGDIHTHQYLNDEKTIAYPSSLIQQNHGETISGHGIIVWDLENGNSEFVEIKNDTAFYTIDIENGIHTSIPSDLPQNLYLRVRHKNTSQEDLKRIVKDIKETRLVIETSTTKVKDFDILTRKQSHSNNIDFRNVDSQNLYIRNFLSSSYSLSEQELTSVCEINSSTNLKLSVKETPRNTIWTPKIFQFENMFGYKKDNYIDFSNMKGVYGVFAPNASGKSTLLEAITYCLFDKCSKTSKAQEVMNNQSSDFYCRFEFELNGLIYTIERKAKKHKQGNVRVDVDFYYIDEVGNKRSLNGKERNDTNSNIRKLLGSYEDFTLTSFSTQMSNSSFIDIGQRERKDLLCQFMDLNVFEDLYLVANEEIKEVNYLLKDLEKRDWYTIKSDHEVELKIVNSDIEKSKQNRIKSKSLLEETQEKISNLTSKLHVIDKGLQNFDKQKSLEEKDKLNDSIGSINTKLNNETSNKENKEKELNDLVSKLSVYSKEDISLGLEKISTLKTEIQDGKLNLKQLETQYNSDLQKMKKLKDLKYDENCKFCMDNVFVKDAISTKTKIEEDLKTIDKLKGLIKDKETNLIELSHFEKLKEEHSLLEKSINDKNIEILTSQNTIKDLENKLSSINKTLDQLVDKLDKYTTQENNISENLHTQSLIDDMKVEYKKYKQQDDSINNEYTDLQIKKSLIDKQIEECDNSINKITEYQRKSQIYKYYLECIHRDGIPHMLISQTLPQIEEEVNSILSQLVDFKVLLTADHKNINGYIAYSSDRYWGIELVSGMEKFITSLAIRCALISVSSLPRPNFIFIDEGFGALDKDNLGSIISLFDYLKTQFQFTAIISHIESMRDMVDSIIEITKENGVSRIQHQ